MPYATAPAHPRTRDPLRERLPVDFKIVPAGPVLQEYHISLHEIDVLNVMDLAEPLIGITVFGYDITGTHAIRTPTKVLHVKVLAERGDPFRLDRTHVVHVARESLLCEP